MLCFAVSPLRQQCCNTTDTTGLAIWGSGIVMGHWLTRDTALQHLLHNAAVVELGAGCGVAGIVAAHCTGASSVLLTDLHAATLQNARHNVALNAHLMSNNSSNRDGSDSATVQQGLSTLSLNDGSSSGSSATSVGGTAAGVTAHTVSVPAVAVPEGTATTTTPAAASAAVEAAATAAVEAPAAKHIAVAKLDWTAVPPQPPIAADVVIGCDLIYELSLVTPLVTTVKALLKPGGSLLLSAPTTNRQGMKQLLEALLGPSGGFTVVSSTTAPAEFTQSPLAVVDSSTTGSSSAVVAEVQGILQFPDLAENSYRLLHFKRSAK
jgi:predicted nicotinamide N-methyase